MYTYCHLYNWCIYVNSVHTVNKIVHFIWYKCRIWSSSIYLNCFLFHTQKKGLPAAPGPYSETSFQDGYLYMNHGCLEKAGTICTLIDLFIETAPENQIFTASNDVAEYGLWIGYGNVHPPPPSQEKRGEFKIFPGFSPEFIVNKISSNKSPRHSSKVAATVSHC